MCRGDRDVYVCVLGRGGGWHITGTYNQTSLDSHLLDSQSAVAFDRWWRFLPAHVSWVFPKAEAFS